MNPLATEAALVVMGLNILVLGVAGLLIGGVNLAHSIRRVLRNRRAGSMHEWSWQQLWVVGGLFAMVVLFAVAGGAVTFLPDGEPRDIVARLSLLAAFYVLVWLLWAYSVSQSRIEALATREAEDRSVHESPRRADRPPGWSGRGRQLEKKGER